MPKLKKSVPLTGNWKNGNEEEVASLWALANWTTAFVFEFPKAAKIDPMFHVMYFEGKHFWYLVPEAHSQKISEVLFKRVKKNPASYTPLSRAIKRECQKLLDYSKRMEQTDPHQLSDNELAAAFENFNKAFAPHCGIGMISTLVDIPHGLFTNYFKKFLEKHVKEQDLPKTSQEYFNILSAIPDESEARLQMKDLYRILKQIQCSPRLTMLFSKNLKILLPALKAKPDLWRRIERHKKKYGWVYYGYVGPAMDERDIVKELKILIKEKKRANLELEKIAHEKKYIPINIAEAEKELGLKTYDKAMFKALRETVWQKLYRKDIETFGFFVMEPFIKELAKRAKVSYLETLYLLPGEHRLLLEGDQMLKRDLKPRLKYAMYVGNTIKPYVLSGAKAKAIKNKIFKPIKSINIKEFSGEPACLGKVRGRARIIMTSKDMPKMKKDDILISIATSPEIVPAMKKAAAIVTEQGGITSHAAIVSRELNIPCIIGTNIATKAIKDGDLLEVNANTGLIRILDKK